MRQGSKESSWGYHPAQAPTAKEMAVAEALEIARDSVHLDLNSDLMYLLATALDQVWAKIQAQPESYIMSRNEFAVFNFFQHNFKGNEMAIDARKRYWDHASA